MHTAGLERRVLQSSLLTWRDSEALRQDSFFCFFFRGSQSFLTSMLTFRAKFLDIFPTKYFYLGVLYLLLGRPSDRSAKLLHHEQ